MSTASDRLAAKIALLKLVTELPESCTVATVAQCPAATHPQREGMLSFAHEKSIAQHLAFICAYSEDPLHVLALCVEQSSGNASMTVRIAANTGKHDFLLQGLRTVADLLQEEANAAASLGLVERRAARTSVVTPDTPLPLLLKAVVSLNRLRMLFRLRSRHANSARKKDKLPLINRLELAVELLQNNTLFPINRLEKLSKAIASLRAECEDIERMGTEAARSEASVSILCRITRKTHDILRDFRNDFKQIPLDPKHWHPSTTQALLNCLAKLSKYAEACDELRRAARRCACFRRISLNFIDLQQNSSPRSDGETAHVIRATLNSRILNQVSARRRQSPHTVSTLVSQALLNGSRLHAEIQLLLFYESHPGLPRPRVICSSKSACFLCNLFIKLHGTFFIPSAHGRLYDTWKWPAAVPTCEGDMGLQLQNLQPAFEKQIDRTIRACLARHRKLRPGDPFESRVDIFGVMTPSCSSVRSAATVSQGATAEQNAGPFADTESNGGADSPNASPSIEPKPETPAITAPSTPRQQSSSSSPPDPSEPPAIQAPPTDPLTSPSTTTLPLTPPPPPTDPLTSPSTTTLPLTPPPPPTDPLTSPSTTTLPLTPPPPPSPAPSTTTLVLPPTHPLLWSPLATPSHQLTVSAPGLRLHLHCTAAPPPPLPPRIELQCLPAAPAPHTPPAIDLRANWTELTAPDGAMLSAGGLRLQWGPLVLRLRLRFDAEPADDA